MIPKVKFVYSWSYDSTLCMLLKRKWKLTYVKSSVNYIRRLDKEWRKIEKKVLSEMAKTAGMKWKDKQITCFVVSHCIHSFSYPLTVIIRHKDDRLRRIDYVIDILIHELIHVLFVSNEIYNLDKYLGFDKEFKNEKMATNGHIYLHALHKHLYLKFFNKNRLARDIALAKSKSMPGYDRAWEIVEEYGHENLIKRLRNAVKNR